MMQALELKTKSEPETVEQWWALVHPHAVRLEKLITPAPATVSNEHLPSMRHTLRKLHEQVQELPYPDEANQLRESLLRATKHLYLCYREESQTGEECEFYYYNALMQVAQLHHLLVQYGFAN